MATSGQVRTREIDDGTYFYVDWQRAGEPNIPGNYEDINWQHKIHCRWSYGSNAVRSNGVNINGVNVYNGATFSGLSAGDHELASGTIRIYHNSDGSKIFNINLSGWVIDGGDTSGSQDFELNNIPRQANVTNATNFNDEQNPTINYTNPGGFRINARLEFGGTLIQRDNIPNTGTYTFELTNEERELLRSKCPNSNTLGVRLVIATCIGGTTETNWSWQDKIMTIINANPIFSDFDFEDVNPITLALTGNNKVNVNGYSNIKATITVANKAVAQKGATMSEYRLVVGDKTQRKSYDDENDVEILINEVNIGAYQLYAIDSRGNTTLVTKVSSQDIDYEQMVIDKFYSKAYRSNNGNGDDGYLKYKGTIWNGNFGLVQNSIVSASYEFKKTDSETWIRGTTDITPTITNDEFNFDDLVKSDNIDYKFDLDESYNFRITIEDKLSIIAVELSPMASATPNISINKNGVGIMCNYDPFVGGLLQVGGEKIDNIDTYSTSEKKTNKIWVNNKPIYRISFYISSLPNANTLITSYSISNLEWVTAVYGSARNKNNYNNIFPINNTRPQNNNNAIGAYFDTYLKIETYTDRSGYEAYITVEYTKTTD